MGSFACFCPIYWPNPVVIWDRVWYSECMNKNRIDRGYTLNLIEVIMKRFYSLLLIGAALLSSNLFGMEKIDIQRDYPDVVQYLRNNGHNYSEEQAMDYETFALDILPLIEQFVVQKNKQEDQYVVLCIAYLNHCFSLPECNAERVER